MGRPTRLTRVSVEPPPEHVLAAFGLTGVQPASLGSSWEGGWRCGEVVLSMVADHARAAWSARVRETLFVDGVRLARPVRSTDGRYVVSGWRADTFVAGTPEARHDEVVSAAVRLHEATSKLERPRFLTQGPTTPWAEVDVFIAADRAAWEERPLQSIPPGARSSSPTADAERSIDLINQLATLRKPTRSPNQVVHGDLYGTVLFVGAAAPGITDITPYWRPASWAAGVVVVDALSWGEADDGLIERWSALPEWPQMLLRALMFRLAVHALHPRSTAEAFPGLARTAALVRLML
ncbi:TIGR02569 family protein [Mycobacterium kansasii]|nr:TIGR02569 family protein [Mycobacterium kansasii]